MTEPTLDENILRKWVGNQESRTDTLHPAQARLMQAMLNQEPDLEKGHKLPPIWHWTYFLEGKMQSELGRDGHPLRGGFLPPVALPRRMWAGGRLEFLAPLILGDEIRKTSTIGDVRMKSGHTGLLCFVTVRHAFTGPDNKLLMTEEHDIVYREDPTPGAPKAPPVRSTDRPQVTKQVIPSETQLFRYSALTFNSHRIHYDRDYCRDVEGYPGLVFHGPLTATLLAELALRHRENATMRSFSFRAVSPLFDNASFSIHANNEEDETQLWASDQDNHLAMTATAAFN